MFSYQLLWQAKLVLVPYLLLAMSIVSLWFTRRVYVWGSFLGLAILAGLIFHRLTPVALIPLFGLILTFYCFYRYENIWIKVASGLLGFILGSMILFFHALPGFNNIVVAHQLLLSKDSLPFTLYLNFDKPFLGLVILAFGFSFINPSSFAGDSFKKTSLPFLLLLLSVIPISLLIGYVNFDPKWNNFFYLWATNNLLMVCFSEEVFFRGFVQRTLTMLFTFLKLNSLGNYLALIIASLLFGLMHYWGGVTYAGLSTLAGLFYGFIYLRSGRIEMSILAHFLLNVVHFLFFSYPALLMSTV